MSNSNGFKLTNLEKAVLLKKAGIVPSILEGRDWFMQEIDGVYDAEKTPAGKWEDEEGRGENQVFNLSLSGRKFVLLVKETNYFNCSNPGHCNCCGFHYYIFRSEGTDLDAARVSREKMEELLKRDEKHLPEALDMFREEYVQYVK